MPKTPQQLASNRRYMARRLASPEMRAKTLAAARIAWKSGRNVRQREYLERLKARDFFKWKSRRSYIALSANQLRELWEKQNGFCALTGRPLDVMAEIDHILPIAKGGDNSLSNSRWLCREANQAKHCLTDEQFFELCRVITTSIAYTEWIGRRLVEALANSAGGTR